jgi:catechol 2,3-dioxygenase-like lactoylglutathione lyase family enzyme
VSVSVRLDHVVIAVSDWKRSNAFYGAVLGAELVELERHRYAYAIGDQRLYVHGPAPTRATWSPVIPCGRATATSASSGGARLGKRPSTCEARMSRSSPGRSSERARVAGARACTSETRMARRTCRDRMPFGTEIGADQAR